MSFRKCKFGANLYYVCWIRFKTSGLKKISKASPWFSNQIISGALPSHFTFIYFLKGQLSENEMESCQPDYTLEISVGLTQSGCQMYLKNEKEFYLINTLISVVFTINIYQSIQTDI